MTGMMPTTIPTLTSSWKRIIDARPAAMSIPNVSARLPADEQDPPNQQAEQHEQHDPADEAEDLGFVGGDRGARAVRPLGMADHASSVGGRAGRLRDAGRGRAGLDDPFQVLVNVGMVVGVMPVTGIPLPFVTSGGSIADQPAVRARHPPVRPDALPQAHL